MLYDLEAVSSIIEVTSQHARVCPEFIGFTPPVITSIKGFCGRYKVNCKSCGCDIAYKSNKALDEDDFN